MARTALCLAFVLRIALAERLIHEEKPNGRPKEKAPTRHTYRILAILCNIFHVASDFPLARYYRAVLG